MFLDMDHDGIRVTATKTDDGIRVTSGQTRQASETTGLRLPNSDIQVDSTWKLSKSLAKCFSLGSQVQPIYDLSTSILSSNKLRKRLKPSDMDLVAAHRSGNDSYSHQPIINIVKPAIDHVVEIQCLSYCVAKVLHSDEGFVDRCTKILKPHINIVENYNVTSSHINSAKMNVFRTFIRDKVDHGLPILSLMIGTSCEKYMYGISETFQLSFQHVCNSLNNIVNNNSNLSVNRYVRDIIEEFQEFYMLLKFDDTQYFRE